MAKKALIIGAGLGGLATALRLSSRGYEGLHFGYVMALKRALLK